MVTKTKKKRKIKLTKEQKEERLHKQQERLYFRSIEDIFKNSGFDSLPCENTRFNIGNRPDNEMDHCFVLENIIVICEQTTGKKNTDHLLKKQETAATINHNKEEFLNHLTEQYEGLFNKETYGVARWQIFYLYFSKQKIVITEQDKGRFNQLAFITIGTYNYFKNMAKSLKKSFRYEILRFLKIDQSDFGRIVPGGTPVHERQVSIIYPNDVTGLNGGVGIVSFMMSPEELIKTSYVLRKDNWEEKIGLYQRLITEKRIKGIRRFIIEKKRTFFNNIIVALPDTVRLYNEHDEEISISSLRDYQNCKMKIDGGFNSISIIDGQHRVYAYYEDSAMNNEETVVSDLRGKLNLLVTGIIFPTEWDEIEKMKFQSEIFLEINRNAKSVDKDILIHIQTTKDPFSALSIARMTLEKMNQRSPFQEMFELSLVEKAQIKVSSIMQYALSSLVNPKEESNGLYKYWQPKNGIDKPGQLDSEELLSEYVDFCASSLCAYFSAIKEKYQSDWTDPKSTILRIVSINGFIIGLHRSLRLTKGIQTFGYYQEIFLKSNIDFNKEVFPYAGSRYGLFATEVIDQLFYKHLEEDYLSSIALDDGAELSFLEDESIIAVVNNNGTLKYGEKDIGIYQLSLKVKGCDELNVAPGMLWLLEGVPIHQIYEEKTN